MKIEGLTRTLDDLGRIVIPKEIRNRLDLKEGDQLEIIVINQSIVLCKPE